MSIRGLQRLLMILGGKVAAEFRAIVETTFTRVMAGDTSLIKVIQANAKSNAPIQQAFRNGLANDPNPGNGPADTSLDEITCKRQKLEEVVNMSKEFTLNLEKSHQLITLNITNYKLMGDAKLEQDKKQMEQELEFERIKRKDALEYEKALEDARIASEAIKRKEEFEYDNRKKAAELAHEKARMELADQARKSAVEHRRNMLQTIVPLVTPAPKEDTITIYSVYLKLKQQLFKLTKAQENTLLCNTGKTVKEAFQTRFGESPTTIEENGRARVNAYPTKAEPMIQESLRNEYRKLQAGNTPQLTSFLRVEVSQQCSKQD